MIHVLIQLKDAAHVAVRPSVLDTVKGPPGGRPDYTCSSNPGVGGIFFLFGPFSVAPDLLAIALRSQIPVLV